ncbi:hypothetical protein WA588_006178 [Blastocystis sp. NMH]
MKSILLCLLLSCALAASVYSYSDKCYRYEMVNDESFTLYYQYYINRKGLPLSSDFIVYQRNYGMNKPLMWSYYYHHVLSNCVREETKFRCVRTCESVWFKIWNVTAAGKYGEKCDKAFIGKYGNIMEHGCEGMDDPFKYVKPEIGKVANITLTMVGKKPETPHGYTEQKECIWEYDILGLWSMVTLVIVCSVITVAVLILIALVVFTQKHRSNKRKRLEGSLMRNSDPAV